MTDGDGREGAAARPHPIRAIGFNPSFLAALRTARKRWNAEPMAAVREYLRLFDLALDRLAPNEDLAMPIAQLAAALEDVSSGNGLPAWIERPQMKPGRPRDATVTLTWRAAVIAGVERYPPKQREIAVADIARELDLPLATIRAWFDRYDRGTPEPSAAEKGLVDRFRAMLAEAEAAPGDVPFYLGIMLAGRERPTLSRERQERRARAGGK